MAVLNPEKADPRGYGYQTIQSMIAVGSGGMLGKGVAQGTQGRLGFLPYAYSDFIGAVVAEETGFAGVCLMMVLYLVFIWRMIAIARNARDRTGAMMIMGFVALITFHIVCNLGMVVGLDADHGHTLAADERGRHGCDGDVRGRRPRPERAVQKVRQLKNGRRFLYGQYNEIQSGPGFDPSHGREARALRRRRVELDTQIP